MHIVLDRPEAAGLATMLDDYPHQRMTVTADGTRVTRCEQWAVQLPDGTIWRDPELDPDDEDGTVYCTRVDAEDRRRILVEQAADDGDTGYRPRVVHRQVQVAVDAWGIG